MMLNLTHTIQKEMHFSCNPSNMKEIVQYIERQCHGEYDITHREDIGRRSETFQQRAPGPLVCASV